MMKRLELVILLLLLATFSSWAQPVLTVNGVNANYTTTHVFVDEVANDAVPLSIAFTPNTSNLTDIEIFTNVNRRDRAALDADADGVEDGIVPPNGNLVTNGSDAHYYKAYTMTPTNGGAFTLTLSATKTGAYRLTGRYKVSGNTNWIYYNNFNNQRDHCVVVSPKRARDIVMYELNTLNVEAQGTAQNDRSTFADLWDGPGARAYNGVSNKFNLAYLQSLGVNWLWFQPIHPQAIAGRQTDPDTSQPYEVGSPYAVKNFFEVMPLMSKGNTRAAAREEFTNFVAAADGAGMNVMLDAPFNHTAYDCELAASGVFYFNSNAAATDELRNTEARFYSKSGDYCDRASGAGNIAIAPDRGDFGKFGDTYDVFFGRYAALVCQNPGDNGNHLNEGDWFDTNAGSGHFDTITHNVWKYFGDYILYWLDQTGCPANTAADQTYRGIDGLRADFGQGLPPQCWEYLINKARSRKWNFVFMSESLDGGAVTYRSNRHFDILNENILFDMKSAGNASDYRNLFESRRASYGQGLVLLNSNSHDEENYDDPFQALIRYLVCGTIDGAPMIFYGQEQGVTKTFGFDRYELNFSKTIPQFKKFNSLQPVLNPANRNFGLDQLYPVFAAVGQARQFSRALRSSNRYFLDRTTGGAQPNIYSVAKYETANGAPNFSDVVFGFANLDRNNDQSGTFNVNITQGPGNLFGIKSNRTYNVKNIAAYTAMDGNRRNVWLWGAGGITGSNVLANGVFVGLNRVPTSEAGWTNAPFEAQYLKLYDVTPPPAPGTPATPASYVVGTNVTFAWSAVNDPEGGISGYHVIIGTTPGGSNVFDGSLATTNKTAGGSYGQTLYARVSALNNAGIEGALSGVSAGTILLDPAADNDGDGASNQAEASAGTNPLDAGSVLKILNLSGDNLLTWSSVSGKIYQVLATTSLPTNFQPVSGVVTAGSATASLAVPVATNQAKFYRIQLQP